MLEWVEKRDRKLVCDFWERWPSLEESQAVPAGELKQFFHHRAGRHGELTGWRMKGMSQAMPAIRDRAVIEAKRTVVQGIAGLLPTLLEGIATWTVRSPRQRKPIRIFSFSSRCREPGQHWHRVYWPLWVRNAIGIRVRTRYRSTLGLGR